MKAKLNLLIAGMFLAATSSAVATVRYVNVNNAHPTPPYTNWATAATNIQDAVDAAGAGDEVVVTNGTYASVSVNTPLTLQSVNGPGVTIINGGGTNGCVYLATNSVVVGFTLTYGWSGGGGGVSCESTNAVLTNCVLTGNGAELLGGGAYGGTLNNCTLTDNFVSGLIAFELNNRTLTGNSPLDGWYGGGGGASYCTLNNCTLSGNFGRWGGGGASGCTLNNCMLTSNTAYYGGGAYGATLNNCTLTGNSGYFGGGGAYGGTLNNCTLTENSASYPYGNGHGGGACSCTLNNCTLTGNSAKDYAGGDGYGGADSCTLNNCIVYFNTDGNYDFSSTLNYCCTTPLPTNGAGNISADPQLASASYLSAQSPCLGAGSASYASGTDVDGEPWSNPPSIGCDEYHAGAVTGPLTVSLTSTLTLVPPGIAVGLTGSIAGRTDWSLWKFGDGDVEVNEPYTSHTWTAPGDYPVSLWAYNDSYPGGVRATLTIHVEGGLYYVAATNGNPVAPYTSWATAATNIQDAVDVAVPTGATIFVTKGTYAPVRVSTPLILRGVNGPAVTLINGGGSKECVYLANDAMMVGFTLTNGRAQNGGGVDCESTSAVLSNCMLTGNSADYNGGGAFGGTLNNCTLTGNLAREGGGGAESSILNNCALTGNSAWNGGGGANDCTLNNCTLTGNSAYSGGGAYGGTLNNCIVYFNSVNYDSSSTLNYCCTTPMPTNGVGNISADPQLASASHLSAQSPCLGAGSASYASGTDIDGEPWSNPPSIGCDEYHAGAVTGPLTVSLTSTLTLVSPGLAVGLTGSIAGRTDWSLWDFGDGDGEVNEPYTSHTWTAPGYYPVSLWAYNNSYPEGVRATLTIHVDEGLYYVAATNGHPVAPYTSWATAATNIQAAVDVATQPGATILVANGTYAPVSVSTPLILRGVNGPEVTVINGGGTNECVYLANVAMMVGFTLRNGSAENGGGVDCESTSAVLTNCVLTGNSADYNGGGAYGGTLNNCTLTGNLAWGGGAGACGSTLNNCTLTGNWAWESGGGAVRSSILNNCTLTGNSAYYGSGAYGCTLNNCIVYFSSVNYDSYSTLNYCCTTPMPTNGVGNITNAPLFVNYAGRNLRLQSNSPCINSGNNAYVVGSSDLDGNPRIAGGTVDMGAYEYQTPVSMVSYAWLQQYGLPIKTNTDTTDPDGTGMNVYQDWIAGLNPTNALSVLRMTSATATNNPAGLVVTWQSVSGIMYFLQSSTNLAAQPAFITIQSNILGQPGTTSSTDTTARNAGPHFYRVGVGN